MNQIKNKMSLKNSRILKMQQYCIPKKTTVLLYKPGVRKGLNDTALLTGCSARYLTRNNGRIDREKPLPHTNV